MSQSNRIVNGIFSLLLAVFLWVASPVRNASAHGIEVLRSDPTHGVELAQSPSQVKVWFSEEMQTKESTLQVYNERGIRFDDGKGGVDLDDPDHASMKVNLADLPVGVYTVKWHALLTDGDVADGQFRFAVGQPMPAEAAYPPPARVPKAVYLPPASLESNASSSHAPRWLIPVIAVGVLGLSVVIGFCVSVVRRSKTG
jgi:copper resistance protein C